jgi:hypothetical protein
MVKTPFLAPEIELDDDGQDDEDKDYMHHIGYLVQGGDIAAAVYGQEEQGIQGPQDNDGDGDDGYFHVEHPFYLSMM